MGFIDDIKKIDPRELDFHDVGGLPGIVKGGMMLGAFLVVLFLGYFLDWGDQLDLAEAAKAKEGQLRTTFLEKKKQAVNLPAYKQQLKDTEEAFGALLRQLPSKAEMEGLITDINQAGLGRGLQFELFKPAARENMKDFYAELPVNIQVTGGYHDFGAFASDIGRLPRIVVLANGKIEPQKDGTLTMKVVAQTYRYLDASEMAAQKKSSKPGGKK